MVGYTDVKYAKVDFVALIVMKPCVEDAVGSKDLLKLESLECISACLPPMVFDLVVGLVFKLVFDLILWGILWGIEDVITEIDLAVSIHENGE